MKYMQRIQKLNKVREQRLAKQRGYRDPPKTSKSPKKDRSKSRGESISPSKDQGINPLIHPRSNLKFDF